MEVSAKMLNTEKPGQDFPILSGPGIKGAAVRAIIPFVSHLMDQLDDGTKQRRRRNLMFQGLLAFYRIVETSGTLFSACQLSDLQQSVHTIMINYAYMVNYHRREAHFVVTSFSRCIICSI